MSLQLSDKHFRLMCPRLPSARRAELLPHINAALARFGIDTKLRVAAFLSNLMHESGSFKYSREIWGPTPAQRRYEGRRDLGNTLPGDGKRFMGRGFIQTTGRGNYRRVGRALGLDLEAQPEMLEQPRNAALSAAFFWHDNKLNRLADCLRGKRDASEQKTLAAICKRINGGTNGLAERVTLYWRALAVLSQEPEVRRVEEALEQKIAASPAIPTPETHTPEQIAAAQADPGQREAAEAAEVAEQTKAARVIDLAEKTPASVLRATATSLWSRTGGRVVQTIGLVYAALQAGSFFAWAGVAVVALALLYVVYQNRHDLRRWKFIALSKVKELTSENRLLKLGVLALGALFLIVR